MKRENKSEKQLLELLAERCKQTNHALVLNMYGKWALYKTDSEPWRKVYETSNKMSAKLAGRILRQMGEDLMYGR